MLRPNGSQLAMRDPALAAIMGAIPSPGADYGFERSRPQARRVPASQRRVPRVGADFGNLSPFDVSRNMGFGFGFGQDPAAGTGTATPHPAEVAAAWQAHTKAKAHTDSRESLLDPNKFSTTKVERYSFSLSQALVLNTPLASFTATLQPNTTIRPQRVVMNAPTPNFVLLTTLQMANVNVFIGSTEDAVTYSGLAQGVMLDLPTLLPSNRATAIGSYTGFVPPGFANGFGYTFIITFQGPSTIAGQGPNMNI